jgi:hypothetical protein
LIFVNKERAWMMEAATAVEICFIADKVLIKYYPFCSHDGGHTYGMKIFESLKEATDWLEAFAIGVWVEEKIERERKNGS